MEGGMLRYPPVVKLFHFLKMKWHLTVFYILVHYREVDSELFHKKNYTYYEVTKTNPCASISTHFYAHPNLTEQVEYFFVSIEKCSSKFQLGECQAKTPAVTKNLLSSLRQN